jgi:hypothetical protein
LAHYARSFGLSKAVYLVFAPRHLEYPDDVLEQVEIVESIEIHVYLVSYDEVKDF